MPQNEYQGRLEKLLPESVYKALIEAGVDVNDEKVVSAIVTTALAFEKIEEDKRHQIRRAFDEATERINARERNETKLTMANVALIAAGLAALAGALTTGFEAFAKTLSNFFHVSVGDLVGTLHTLKAVGQSGTYKQIRRLYQ